MRTKPTVLTIAGSDPSGGAGIQGDLKTFAALGAYGMAAITAITVQNTRGVTRVEALEPDLVAAQIDAVLTDIAPGAIKIGMLATGAIVRVVADAIEAFRRAKGPVPIVLDPVLAATRGGALLEEAAIDDLKQRLLPLAAVVTPNAMEASRLTGLPVRSVEDAGAAAKQLVAMGAASAIVTGGHLDGPPVDVLYDGAHLVPIEGERIPAGDTHGTGCAFASALATGLARGDRLETAARQAKTFVAEAIARAPKLGHGRGPVGHS